VTGIAPWLSVADAAEALTFYRAAFGAVAIETHEHEGIVQVAQLWVGGADFWIQHEPDTPRGSDDDGGRTVRMILTVDEPEIVLARAIAAGGTEVFPVRDANGWHIGRVIDPFGHHWEIGFPLGP
jgi:PhnB protein